MGGGENWPLPRFYIDYIQVIKKRGALSVRLVRYGVFLNRLCLSGASWSVIGIVVLCLLVLGYGQGCKGYLGRLYLL